jgi:transforming growth factor-beta-induced protein
MKTIRNKFFLVILAVAAMVVVTSCDKDDDDQDDPKNIVEIAASDPQFSILVEALTKAELVATLEGPGPFTVFAPTNDAFEALFTDLGVSGIADLSKEALTPILLYHVVSGTVKSTDLYNGYFSSLSPSGPDGNVVQFYVNVDAGVKINGSSSVTTADIMASNGVIHVIDKVMLPQNIAGLAIANPDFSLLISALVRAGLDGAVAAPGPYTVFAPNNAAFEAALDALGFASIDDIPIEVLTSILLYHVIEGNVRAEDVTTGTVPTLLPGKSLDIVAGSGVKINDSANVIATDVQGTNGVFHVIDAVLIPL